MQRLAVVVPPADWLNGILRAYHDLYREALTALGFATIDVPLQAFLQPDAGRILPPTPARWSVCRAWRCQSVTPLASSCAQLIC